MFISSETERLEHSAVNYNGISLKRSLVRRGWWRDSTVSFHLRRITGEKRFESSKKTTIDFAALNNGRRRQILLCAE